MVLEESFSLRLWFSDTTRLRRDYDAIMTGLRRDYDAIWFLMTQLHLAYSPVPYLVGCLAAKELHGASLISLAITLNPSRMSVKYVIGIWVRASA